MRAFPRERSFASLGVLGVSDIQIVHKVRHSDIQEVTREMNSLQVDDKKLDRS